MGWLATQCSNMYGGSAGGRDAVMESGIGKRDDDDANEIDDDALDNVHSVSSDEDGDCKRVYDH